jgi:hypothetical protein
MRKRALALAIVALLSVSIFFALHSRLQRNYELQFNASSWAAASTSDAHLGARQKMIKDLVSNVLPGKTRAEVEQLLGVSPTHEQMRRHKPTDLLVRQRDKNGEWMPFPKTGEGYYYDEFDWDLLYYVGLEQEGLSGSPKRETLILRFNDEGLFESWFIDGSRKWPKIVGNQGSRSYREKRG